jgi:hypothetical protein
MSIGEGFLLLALPDSCLLRVLQCCAADDACSLFNAARAHSRLHQAAVLALHSISTHVSQQLDLEGVLVYLGKHGQHVNSLRLWGNDAPEYGQAFLCQLPPQLQLSGLQLQYLPLQLQPGKGSQGVLGAAAAVAALKQLRLDGCEVLDDGQDEALAAALAQLPAGLEHLSISNLHYYTGGLYENVQFPAAVLQQLNHLIHLKVGWCAVAGADEAGPALQPLQALTRLVELKIGNLRRREVITSSMLSGMQQLTRLELSGEVELDPAALAGKTQLQHLGLNHCVSAGGAAWVAQLLPHLQPLQQLTHLSMSGSLLAVEGSTPPASAYAALTASSKLQHLNISRCTLPASVWQHVFPAGRLLPNLQSLIIDRVKQPSGGYAQPPEGSDLVRCCPGLQSLQMGSLQGSAELLAPLKGLSRLQTLNCNWGDATAGAVQAVCQLTGLRGLIVHGSVRMKEEGLLLQLAQLQQLTWMQYWESDSCALTTYSGELSSLMGCSLAVLACMSVVF